MQQTTGAILRDTFLAETTQKKKKKNHQKQKRRVVPEQNEGDIYRGTVSGKVPHGHGKYLWWDGCMYEGEWRKGRPCGIGTFSWPSGATYQGRFHFGHLHGFGTFIGPNGDSYSGSWHSGRKHGSGLKRYSNGDLYDGLWSRGLQHGRGRYVWSSTSSEYVGEWVRGTISGYGVLMWDHGNQQLEGYWDKGVPVPAADDNHTIKHHVMDSLQIGIAYSVGNQTNTNAAMMHELTAADFHPHQKLWTRFPTQGSNHTPPHHSRDFKWKDYCPTVFHYFRQLFSIDSADYMVSICGNHALSHFSSPGKSGSFFFLTHDHRFIIKSIKKSELKVLIKMLPSYHQHVSHYNNSLLTKFLGLHCIKPVGGPKTRLVVMANLFCSDYRIHRRYDLKGSSHGRTIDKCEAEIDETTTLKDLDLDLVFRLEASWFEQLIWQIERDCEFLESERIMDYSLLIGIHFRSHNFKSVNGDCDAEYDESDEDDGDDTLTLRSESRSDEDDESHDTEWAPEGRFKSCSGIRLGVNMPGRSERVDGEIYEVVINLGIIDILQDYDITKKLEHAYKSLQVDPTSISAVDPNLYSKRFQDFIHAIFLQQQ